MNTAASSRTGDNTCVRSCIVVGDVPPTQTAPIEQDARGGPLGQLDEGSSYRDPSNASLDALEPESRLHAVMVVAECRCDGAFCRALPDDAVVDWREEIGKHKHDHQHD